MYDYFFHIAPKRSKIDAEKCILIIVKKSDIDVANQELLQKIIAALKISMEKDCQLLELDDNIHLGSTISHCEKIIAFDIQPSQLGFNFNAMPYRVLSMEQQKLLFADSLSTLKSSENKKAILWKSLQLLFGIVK